MKTDFEENKIKFSTGFSMKNIPRAVGDADMGAWKDCTCFRLECH